jgi:ferric-dicitrate binding protein FerR (iron transport regulator)
LPEKTVFLTRNAIGTWNANDNQITVCEIYDDNINSALSGRLSFTDTPLKEIIKDFERHYQVKIELTDKSLESRKYTGTFSHVEPEKTLGIISMSLNISVEKNGNIYIIRP